MPQQAPEVEQVVRDWLDAKQRADRESVSRLLGGYEGTLGIGTDASEWISGLEPLREAHLRDGPFAAKVEELEAHRAGNVGWAAMRAVIETGEPGGLPLRFTVVLVEGPGGWEIVQSHASTPRGV